MATREASGPPEGEACAGCGEDTSIGSALYSDRRRIEMEGGSQAFLCSLCDQRLAASRDGSPLGEDELRRLIKLRSVAMIAAWPAGNLPPG